MRAMQPRGAVALLVLLVAVVFGPTLTAGFVWDDDVLITYNARLRGDGAWQRALTDDFWDTSNPIDARRGYWRPVVKLSHVALSALGRGAPWPFHLFNTALHLACVLLVFRWLRARLASAGVAPDDAVRPALLGAALFALHASRFEAVGWVSCSTDLLMTLFALLALWALERQQAALAAGLVALAMLSKESLVVLPLALIADGLLRRALERRAVVAALVGLAVPLVARAALGLRSPSLDVSALAEAPLRAVAAFGEYHLRTAWPFPPTAFALAPGPDLVGLARFGAPVVALGVVAALAWAAWAFAARTRPRARAFLADGVWWLLPLLPFLQLVPVPASTFASDRFLYFPLLGACAVLVRALTTWPSRVTLAVTTGALAASAVALSLALPAYASGFDFFAREHRLHPASATVGSAFAGELQRARKPWARRALLLKLASQREDRTASVRALGQLGSATLEVTLDDEPRTLAALARFYDALLSGHPIDWELGDERRSLVDPALLARQVKLGTLDDLELFAATVALGQGRLDDAEARAQRLLQSPTPRRSSLAARVAAARGDFVVALARVEALPALRGSALHQTLRRAAALEPRTASSSPELTLAWVEVWHGLRLLAQEDEALRALGEESPLALQPRLLALVDRGHFDEALALVQARAAGTKLEQDVRTVIDARLAERAAELELISP
jgi:hypothetical protein